MASEVDICNLALSYLGDEATVSSINPPEASMQAEHCQRFYPIARNAVLELHPFGFATRRAALVQVAGDPPTSWAYQYALPNKCLRALTVLPADYTDDEDGGEFEQETLSNGTRVIYTDVEDATLRFVYEETTTTKYSMLVVNAIARLLASYLAGPLIKGDTGVKVGQAHLKQFMGVDLPMATAADSNARRKDTYMNFTPGSISARA